MVIESDTLNKINELEVNKDIIGLKDIKMIAEAGFDGDIAGAAEQAITRLTTKAEEVAKLSPNQEKQVENLEGSKDELNERTETIDNQIKNIDETAERKIGDIENETTQEVKTKIAQGEVIDRFKRKFGENYFVTEELQRRSAEVGAFLEKVKNSASNPDTVNEAIDKFKEDSITMLAENGAVQAEARALGNNPSANLINRARKNISTRLGINVSAYAMNKVLQKLIR